MKGFKRLILIAIEYLFMYVYNNFKYQYEMQVYYAKNNRRDQ